jgi:hypothetical protein
MADYIIGGLPRDRPQRYVRSYADHVALARSKAKARDNHRSGRSRRFKIAMRRLAAPADKAQLEAPVRW